MEQIQIDRYVIDTLMPDLVGHDKRPSALLVYLFLWGHTTAPRGRKAAASLRDIAEGTGLSKRGVQQSLHVLERRRLISRTKSVPTSVAAYEVLRPWRRR
ncbi:MAG: helix-turn-helix domain-containing protein [bacterium]